MKYEYNISEDDYAKSLKLGAKASRKNMVIFFIGAFVLLSIAILSTKFILRFACYGGIIGGVLGYFITVYLIEPLQAKKHYRKYSAIHDPISIEIIDSGFVIANESGESKVKWGKLLKWRENEEYILLYFAPKLFYMIPKRISEKGFDLEVFRSKIISALGSAT